MSTFLKDKTGLIIDFETNGLDPKAAKAFQVSILLGKLESDQTWVDKTYRIEGRPVTDRYLATAGTSKDPIGEDCILPHQELMEKLAALISKVDVVISWVSKYHFQVLACELARAGNGTWKPKR